MRSAKPGALLGGRLPAARDLPNGAGRAVLNDLAEH
jgi:hypothetical protein